jgi:hypothetical protein
MIFNNFVILENIAEDEESKISRKTSSKLLKVSIFKNSVYQFVL